MPDGRPAQTSELRALVFDFDGLLVDTEAPSYAAWCEPFEQRGVQLRLERWLQVVGTHDSPWDPVTELEELTGAAIDRDAVTAAVDERFVQLAHEEPCRPGVLELLDEAEAAGVALGVASSSRSSWVNAHLDRLGLRHRFGAVVGRDLVGWRGKPAPDVYVETLRRLGVGAQHAIALEDSRNGVVAARAAGLTVVAVPNSVTRAMDLSAADAVLDGLQGVSLAQLAALAGNAKRPPGSGRPSQSDPANVSRPKP